MVTKNQKCLLVLILTQANNCCILVVTTVVIVPSQVFTVDDRTFVTQALHIIQTNASISFTKPSRTWSTKSVRKSKLMTHHSSVLYIPQIVTNSSPGAIIKYLHSSFPIPVSANKSQFSCKESSCKSYAQNSCLSFIKLR